MWRRFLLACVCSLGCSGVSSNLPPKMTRQLVHDYHCTELSGTRVAQTSAADVWNVDVCGRQLRVSCPEGPHSRWHRCELTPLGEEPASPAARASRVRLDRGQRSGAPAIRLRLDDAIDLAAVYAPARDPNNVVASLGRAAARDPASCPSVRLTGSAGGPGVELVRLDRRYHAPVTRLLSARLSAPLRFEYCGRAVDLTPEESSLVESFRQQVRDLHGQYDAPSSASVEPGGPGMAAPDSQGAPTGEGSGTVVVVVPAPTAGGEQPDLRAWLDGQREVILGCVSADLAIVELGRGADESVRVSLRPPHAGTPGEECVRAALGTPPGAPPSPPLVHAVRRAAQ